MFPGAPGDQRGQGRGPTRRRPAAHVARDGRLVAVPAPTSVAAFVATPLLSFRTKLAVREQRARPQAREAAPPTSARRADMVRDHFGKGAPGTLVQPLIGGIYAGDAERLSAQVPHSRRYAEAGKKDGVVCSSAAGGGPLAKRKGLGPRPRDPRLPSRGGLQTLTGRPGGRRFPSGLTPVRRGGYRDRTRHAGALEGRVEKAPAVGFRGI